MFNMYTLTHNTDLHIYLMTVHGDSSSQTVVNILKKIKNEYIETGEQKLAFLKGCFLQETNI